MAKKRSSSRRRTSSSLVPRGRRSRGRGGRGGSKSNLSCNKPVKSWRPGKKRAVKACANGKERIIHFGATGYGHNYSPAARRSFRARHKCGNAKNKLTARYWACKNLWSKGGSSQRCPPGRKCKYDGRIEGRRGGRSRKSPRKSGRRKVRRSR